mgnify:CR=1 FL=1
MMIIIASQPTNEKKWQPKYIKFPEKQTTKNLQIDKNQNPFDSFIEKMIRFFSFFISQMDSKFFERKKWL